MVEDGTWRRLRAAIRNALVWGAGWSGFALSVFTVLKVVRILPDSVSWADGLGLCARFGIVGAVTGGAFSTVIRLFYHGRRLSEINWIRFGIAGGIVAGIFVALFLQAMNILSGDGMVAWRLVLDDGIWAAVFGAVVAGGSLKLAQRADTLPAAKGQDQIGSR